MSGAPTAPTAAVVDRALTQSAISRQENAQLRAEAAALRAEAAVLREETALLRKEAAQLHAALSSRIVIEQAVGILAEQRRVPVTAAFTLLRSHCRQQERSLHDVAGEIVAYQNRLAS